jgi:aerobic carbon-monoxide dehydrogenase large subunit
LTTTFLDYLLPSAPEIPDFEFGHVESMSGTLGGDKRMGEGGAIASPPAVANAINDALAQAGSPPLTAFRFGPSQILDLLQRRSTIIAT